MRLENGAPSDSVSRGRGAVYVVGALLLTFIVICHQVLCPGPIPSLPFSFSSLLCAALARVAAVVRLSVSWPLV